MRRDRTGRALRTTGRRRRTNSSQAGVVVASNLSETSENGAPGDDEARRRFATGQGNERIPALRGVRPVGCGRTTPPCRHGDRAGRVRRAVTGQVVQGQRHDALAGWLVGDLAVDRPTFNLDRRTTKGCEGDERSEEAHDQQADHLLRFHTESLPAYPMHEVVRSAVGGPLRVMPDSRERVYGPFEPPINLIVKLPPGKVVLSRRTHPLSVTSINSIPPA